MFVYGTYVLEREVDAKFSLGDVWKLFKKILYQTTIFAGK